MKTHHIQDKNKSGTTSRTTCSYCHEVFETRAGMRRHEKIMHFVPKPEFTCDCGNYFETAKALRKHKTFAHTIGIFPCDQCDEKFTTKIMLSRHSAALHKQMRICEICGDMISQRYYKAHVNNVHNPSELKCHFEGCTKIYTNTRALQYHIESIHSPSQNLKCSKCHKVFKTNFNLKNHLARSHSEQKFSCKVEGCVYAVIRRDCMKIHLKNHKNIDEFQRQELLRKLDPKMSQAKCMKQTS